MKRSRFTENQIIAILNEAEAGVPLAELIRKHGFGESTFYSWKSRYGGMDASQLKRLKELETENVRLKKLYAKVSLEKEVLQEAIEGKL